MRRRRMAAVIVFAMQVLLWIAWALGDISGLPFLVAECMLLVMVTVGFIITVRRES